VLLLDKFLQHFHDTRPSAAVILASNRQIREAAVSHFHVGTLFLSREFPPHQGAARTIVVPIRVPGISENARRIGEAYPETSLSGKSLGRIITDVAALAAYAKPSKPFQRIGTRGARPVR